MAKCDKCGYQWDYSGDMQLATCPSCQTKTTTSDDDDVACDICGDGDEIHYHHVRYDPEEIAPLCPDCHRDVHTDRNHSLYPEDEPDGVHINQTFTDGEYDRLKSVKGDQRTWHDAILEEFGVAEQRTAVRDGGE